MQEFYHECNCRYQIGAQPYLDAIARAIRSNPFVRVQLLAGTPHGNAYATAEPLWEEQWLVRDPGDRLTCPFWANYCYPVRATCDCRVEGSQCRGNRRDLLSAQPRVSDTSSSIEATADDLPLIEKALR